MVNVFAKSTDKALHEFVWYVYQPIAQSHSDNYQYRDDIIHEVAYVHSNFKQVQEAWQEEQIFSTYQATEFLELTP